jgi:succinyl-diaminopimelate desuccinylase
MATLSNPLSLTRELLAFNTIDPPGREHNCADHLTKLLEDRGFKTAFYEFAKGRTSLIAHIKGKGNKAPIYFTGHIDTAPLGATSWSKGPFYGEVDGDKVYGRGSTDMKGGIASMVIRTTCCKWG